MSGILPHIHSYAITFLDIVTLRPKRFLTNRKNNTRQYMGPYQFLTISIVFMCMITYVGSPYSWLHQTPLFDLRDVPSETREGVKAAAVLVISFLYAVVTSLVLRFWPINKPTRLQSVVELHCYLFVFPVTWLVLELLIAAFLGKDTSIHDLTVAQKYLLLLTNAGYIVVSGIFWYWPGLAHIAGTTTTRVVAGLAIWIAIPASTILFVYASQF